MFPLKLIEVRNELGGAKRGAGLGIDALRMEDINSGNDFFSSVEFTRIIDFNADLLKSPSRHFGKFIDKIAEECELIAATVEEALAEEKFPLVLSADHSNAIGTIAGIRNFYADKRVGAIWIDAHADLHSPFTTPSGNIHGMPVAASLGADNLEDKINEITADEKTDWEALKCCGTKKISPKILPSDLVFIGLRDTEAQEMDFIQKRGIRVFNPDDIASSTIETVAEQTLEHLKDCDIIYISFDIDSLDPGIAPGTGTTSPGGLSEKEAASLISILCGDPRLACFELTEINPLLDEINKTAKLGLRLLKSVFLKQVSNTKARM